LSRLKLELKEYAKLAKQVIARDNFKCRVCISRQRLQAHHIVYRSHGGDDAAENLLTVCNKCHRLIHDNRLLLILDGDKLSFIYKVRLS